MMMMMVVEVVSVMVSVMMIIRIAETLSNSYINNDRNDNNVVTTRHGKNQIKHLK